LTQLWRAYDARSGGEKLGAARNFSGGASGTFGQAQGSSPSVFNFFSPFYAPPGEIADAGLVAPEMQLATEYLNTQTTNFFWTQVTTRTHVNAARLNVDDVYIDISNDLPLASNPDGLIDRVATRLLGDSNLLSAEMRAAIKAQLERTTIPATNPTTAQATRVGDALYLILISPSYALQR